MKLTPNTVGSTLENDVQSVGFADFVEAPTRGLVISRMLSPSEQDVEAGQNTYDLSDQDGWSVYAPFTQVELVASALEFTLTSEARSALNLPARLTIDLSRIDQQERESLIDALHIVIPALRIK